MEIQARSADRNLLLRLSGELDHHAAKGAIREMEEAIDAALPRNLVVDMGGVTFMDSSGIAVLLRTQRKCSIWAAVSWCARCPARRNGCWTPPVSAD